MTTPLTVHRSSVAELVDRASHLFAQHHAEAFGDTDRLDVDTEILGLLEDSGRAVVLLARDEAGAVHGYVGAVMSPSLRYRGRVQCFVQLIYVEPEHRNHAIATTLVNTLHQIAEGSSAFEVFWLAEVDSALDAVLSRRDDLARVENGYTKRIK